MYSDHIPNRLHIFKQQILTKSETWCLFCPSLSLLFSLSFSIIQNVSLLYVAPVIISHMEHSLLSSAFPGNFIAISRLKSAPVVLLAVLLD